MEHELTTKYTKVWLLRSGSGLCEQHYVRTWRLFDFILLLVTRTEIRAFIHIESKTFNGNNRNISFFNAMLFFFSSFFSIFLNSVFVPKKKLEYMVDG